MAGRRHWNQLQHIGGEEKYLNSQEQRATAAYRNVQSGIALIRSTLFSLDKTVHSRSQSPSVVWLSVSLSLSHSLAKSLSMSFYQKFHLSVASDMCDFSCNILRCSIHSPTSIHTRTHRLQRKYTLACCELEISETSCQRKKAATATAMACQLGWEMAAEMGVLRRNKYSRPYYNMTSSESKVPGPSTNENLVDTTMCSVSSQQSATRKTSGTGSVLTGYSLMSAPGEEDTARVGAVEGLGRVIQLPLQPAASNHHRPQMGTVKTVLYAPRLPSAGPVIVAPRR